MTIKLTPTELQLIRRAMRVDRGLKIETAKTAKQFVLDAVRRDIAATFDEIHEKVPSGLFRR